MNKTAFIFGALITAVLLSLGLHAAMTAPSIYVLAADSDKEHTISEIFRIFYYHVPSAWTAFLLCLLPAVTLAAPLPAGAVQVLTSNRPAPRTAPLVALAPDGGTVAACGYVYDYAGGTGKVWGTDVTSTKVIQ